MIWFFDGAFRNIAVCGHCGSCVLVCADCGFWREIRGHLPESLLVVFSCPAVETHVMGFCRICCIVYMLCTYIARTERNYHFQWIIVLKYLYVCIPAIATIFLLICEQNIKVYFTRMFSGKITIKSILIEVICMVCRYICFLLLFVHSEN